MKKFLSFVKIEHTLFSLPIVFAGSLLALPKNTYPSLGQCAVIFLAVLGARSAGFAMNRVIDKDIDGQNPRTKFREIPSGLISVQSAWIFIAANCLIFLIAAGTISKTCLTLAPIPLLLFFIYPFLKRFTMWAHLGLGIAWGIAPLGGYLAINSMLSPFARLYPPLLLAVFCIFWVAGFDVVYALLDEKFDQDTGVYSMPSVLGSKDAIIVSELFHFAAFLTLSLLVFHFLNRPAALALWAAAGVLLSISHWKLATEELTPKVIDFAFFKVNAALGFIILLLVWAGR